MLVNCCEIVFQIESLAHLMHCVNYNLHNSLSKHKPKKTYGRSMPLVIMCICIPCTQALDIMRGRNIEAIMDSHLEGNYSTEVATTLVNLASQCLQYEPRDRPDIKKLVSILEPLQTKSEVTIFVLLYFIFD